MAVKTIHTKPRKDRLYIVDYRKLDKPVLLRYDFKNREIAYRAIVNNLHNDTKRYNIITGKDALKHKIKFKGKGNNDEGRIWPDRKYDYPVEESLTPRQKKNFRNKQNQKAYLQRKKERYEYNNQKGPSYIDTKPRRWSNLRYTRRRRLKNREHKLAAQ